MHTHYLLLTTYYLLLATYYLLPTTYYLLLATCYLLLATCYYGDHGFGEDTGLAAAGASDVGRAVPARAATTRAVPMASRI